MLWEEEPLETIETLAAGRLSLGFDSGAAWAAHRSDLVGQFHTWSIFGLGFSRLALAPAIWLGNQIGRHLRPAESHPAGTLEAQGRVNMGFDGGVG